MGEILCYLPDLPTRELPMTAMRTRGVLLRSSLIVRDKIRLKQCKAHYLWNLLISNHTFLLFKKSSQASMDDQYTPHQWPVDWLVDRNLDQLSFGQNMMRLNLMMRVDDSSLTKLVHINCTIIRYDLLEKFRISNRSNWVKLVVFITIIYIPHAYLHITDFKIM